MAMNNKNTPSGKSLKMSADDLKEMVKAAVAECLGEEKEDTPPAEETAGEGMDVMSVIEEAPQNRHPVQTYVLEHDEGVILEALRRELEKEKPDVILSCAKGNGAMAYALAEGAVFLDLVGNGTVTESIALRRADVLAADGFFFGNQK